MIKKFLFSVLILICFQNLLAQKNFINTDSLASYFNDVKTATKKHQHLWKKNLYGPVLLVDPQTRMVYANFPDSSGVLKANGKIFTGVLPQNINLTNTSLEWLGKDWAMILLPLPKSKNERISLITHELFHLSQPRLGFSLLNSENMHLDQRDGRIYLRLELEALKKAIKSPNYQLMKVHLNNALLFRKYRFKIFPTADSTENITDLNEGLAEYTGLICSREKGNIATHFENSINAFVTSQSYAHYFSYHTIPIYGYLLHTTKKDWNYLVIKKTNLTNFFMVAFNIAFPPDLEKSVNDIFNQYNGHAIMNEENARLEKRKKLVLEYRNRFIDKPHLEIQSDKIKFSVDQGLVVPVENNGSIYPYLKATDKWGTLTVKKGALMSTDGKKISLTNPVKTDKKNISGDGWVLELNDGYTISKDKKSGNLKLIRK